MLDIFFNKDKKNFSESGFSKISKRNSSSLKSPKSSSSFFGEKMMSKIQVTDFHQYIDQFVEEINVMQNELVKNPSLAIVDQYRSSIGIFLRHLLDNYQALPFYKGIRKKIELKIWTTINSELDTMARNIIAGNVQGFAVLSQLNMIKGLIIDLKSGQ